MPRREEAKQEWEKEAFQGRDGHEGRCESGAGETGISPRIRKTTHLRRWEKKVSVDVDLVTLRNHVLLDADNLAVVTHHERTLDGAKGRDGRGIVRRLALCGQVAGARHGTVSRVGGDTGTRHRASIVALGLRRDGGTEAKDMSHVRRLIRHRGVDTAVDGERRGRYQNSPRVTGIGKGERAVKQRNGAFASTSDRTAGLELLELLLAPGGELTLVGVVLVVLGIVIAVDLDDNTVVTLGSILSGGRTCGRALKVLSRKALAVMNERHRLRPEEDLHGRRAVTVRDG